MANKIILKKSAVTAKVPVPGDLDFGELALNYADGWLYYKDSAGNIQILNDAPPSGAGSGADADLLDGIDSTEFLRSNTSDQYTSGTLTFNSGTIETFASGATVNFNNTGVGRLTATLSTGTAIVTVTDTTGLVAGQILTKLSGVGEFGATPTVLTIDSATQFTASVNNATAGAIVFSTGLKPFSALSSVKVDNLNADFLDGRDSTYFFSPDNPPTAQAESSTLQDVTGRGQTLGFSTTDQKIEITNTTQSTGNDGNLTDGALIIRGGVGIEKDLHIKGDMHIVGTGTLRFGPYDVGATSGNLWWVREGGLDLDPLVVNGAGAQLWTAFATIKHALQYADFGDTVLVQPGDYEEIFPLVVPAGVSLRGSGLRETQIHPTPATDDLDAFLVSGDSTISDFTLRSYFYNSTNDTGYAFKFADGSSVTSRSTYIERCTVLTRGSTTSGTDPYGFVSGDAGRGAYIDGSKISRASLEAAMLFNEVTFIVPNSRAIIMTNGARSEMLTCFTYFADLAIECVVGATGRAGDGKTYITLSGVVGTFTTGETVRFIGTGGTPTVNFTIESKIGDKLVIDGNLTGLNGLDLSPGAGGSITGLSSGATATEITRYDRTEFGSTLRTIACATEYGNQGVKADGADCIIQLMAHNMSYIGTGADLTNDKTTINQANEIIEANGGRIYYNTIDQGGNYRVGDLFLVDFETGAVTFSGGTFDVTALGTINFIDGADQTTVTAAGITTGNLSFAGNSITTSTGNLTLDPSGSGTIALNGATTVTGTLTATNITSTSTLTHGGLVMSDGGTSGTNNIDQLVTYTKSITLTTDWQDTGIKAADLATGTYLVQLYANDLGSGGTNNNEYYSGTMSWYAGNTDSAVALPTDEIALHRAGASGDAGLYLRTYRTASADADNLKLQIFSNAANVSAANYVFKFRRMI